MADFIRIIDSSSTVRLNRDIKVDAEIYPATGIDVLIVGAGVGGLTAALECYRNGNKVRIFERESQVRTAGEQPNPSSL